MDNIFSFVFWCISSMVDAMRGLEFTAYGFTVNIFDFLLGLFLLSLILPILFVQFGKGKDK